MHFALGVQTNACKSHSTGFNGSYQEQKSSTEAVEMGRTNQAIERNTSFSLCLPFRRARWCLAALALLSSVLTLSCGGGGQSTPQVTAVQVSVLPQLAQVVLQGQVQFTATVTGSSSGVSWSVNGVAGGSSAVGTIDTKGLYTAPTILPPSNMVTVTAATIDGPSQSGTASVTLLTRRLW